jgi:capsular polysaccharide biosynthesis protein
MDGPLRATLVVRRPYETHKYMARRLENEEACAAALRSAGMEVQLVDFARHSLQEQIRIASETDIIAGVHGAGLTHLLWMPPHGGLLEVDPKGGDSWRCFRHLAAWTGREAVIINEQERPISGGTVVRVDPDRFEAAARDLGRRVQARRKSCIPCF